MCENADLLRLIHIIENYIPFCLQIQEVSRNNEEESDYEEDITSFSTCSPSKCSYMSCT